MVMVVVGGGGGCGGDVVYGGMLWRCDGVYE